MFPKAGKVDEIGIQQDGTVGQNRLERPDGTVRRNGIEIRKTGREEQINKFNQ
jgi:hypothetical protein